MSRHHSKIAGVVNNLGADLTDNPFYLLLPFCVLKTTTEPKRVHPSALKVSVESPTLMCQHHSESFIPAAHLYSFNPFVAEANLLEVAHHPDLGQLGGNKLSCLVT
jgi:hypothetical protein